MNDENGTTFDFLQAAGIRQLTADGDVDDRLRDLRVELGDADSETRRSVRDEATEILDKLGITDADARVDAALAPDFDSDLGNARRFVDRYGSDFRFCYAWRKWLHFGAGRWRADEAGAVNRAAKDVARRMLHEAADVQDIERRKHAVKWAVGSQSDRQINAMLSLARSEPGIPILVDELDTNGWLLNCSNGTVDLRTGALHKHNRRQLITKSTAAEYAPNASCPTWNRFLDEVFEGDDELIGFVRRAAGYSLTGETSERVLFVLHGMGANGKSTLIESLLDVVGDYGLKSPAETLMEQRPGGVPNDVARLRGARLVVASESEDGRAFASARVKELTGGSDTITARHMRSEWFEFKPQFSLWFATNHLPEARGDDAAFFDRLRLIPFNRRFGADERDKDLPKRLLEEAPGILAWCVCGALEWQREGLNEPDAVRLATGEYRSDSDAVGRFLDDRALLSAEYRVSASDLRGAYEKWCTENGEPVLSARKVAELLRRRGCEPYRDHSGRMWLGVGLRASMTLS